MNVQSLLTKPLGRKRVLIVGSGWAGHTLVRRLDKRYYDAVLISPRTHFVFTPLLASSAVGTLEFRAVIEPVRSSASIFSRIWPFSKPREHGYIQGWADKVDFKKKEVQVEPAIEEEASALPVSGGDSFNVPYDKLILAVGCFSQTFSTKGVIENAFFLKEVGQARRIRKKILECCEKAALPNSSDAERSKLLHFAIVGGGPTGIEFAAELHDLLHDDLSRLYPNLSQYMKITVYDVAPNILNMFDRHLSEYAEKHFARQGITIKTGVTVEEVTKDGLVLHNGTRKLEPSSLVVWSVGLKANPFVENALGGTFQLEGKDEEWAVKKTAKGAKVVTDGNFRIKMTSGDPTKPEKEIVLPDVFALGDCSAVANQNLPATAQVASQEAIHLAKVLNAAAARGDPDLQSKSLKEFHFRNMGMMAYVGSWSAILEGRGFSVKGHIAWAMWRAAYLSKSVSWRNKILLPIYWIMSWLFGRDVSRF